MTGGKTSEMQAEKAKKNVNAEYLKLVSTLTPKTNEVKTILNAFWVGGVICVVGQFIRYVYAYAFGLYDDALAQATSATLIFLGCLLTGFGVYDRIGHFAGGGSIVPITGFANSVASPAMEFKSEGLVYGLAAKMFVIAGPIIVFGTISSALVGVVYNVFGIIA